jgi:hypothetical protein
MLQRRFQEIQTRLEAEKSQGAPHSYNRGI